MRTVACVVLALAVSLAATAGTAKTRHRHPLPGVGRRTHQPLHVVKETGAASPQLLQSVVTNETTHAAPKRGPHRRHLTQPGGK